MRLWTVAAAFLAIQTLCTSSTEPSQVLIPGQSNLQMPTDVDAASDRASRTPSPSPVQQPSSGPNPIFDESPPKRAGGQHMSIKVKRRRIAQKEQKTWTPAQSAAEESRVMQERLLVAAAEKESREVIAAVKADRERTARVHEALQSLKNAGCKSTYQFFEEFFGSTDSQTITFLSVFFT
ncbi:hypothetical protein B0H10DRAFT_2241138 [Mycena sp. CBHHK59/15]|nr:hypothetical protein B0H10DRAFT_2241138 [Mycena sp. CBHHK59/15]